MDTPIQAISAEQTDLEVQIDMHCEAHLLLAGGKPWRIGPNRIFTLPKRSPSRGFRNPVVIASETNVPFKLNLAMV